MTDIVDQAQHAEAMHLQRAMQSARQADPMLISCGTCHNCDAIIPPGTLFCDADCRDDHAKRHASRKHPHSPYSKAELRPVISTQPSATTAESTGPSQPSAKRVMQTPDVR